LLGADQSQQPRTIFVMTARIDYGKPTSKIKPNDNIVYGLLTRLVAISYHVYVPYHQKRSTQAANAITLPLHIHAG
jgi:hypothetical protein